MRQVLTEMSLTTPACTVSLPSEMSDATLLLAELDNGDPMASRKTA